MSFSKLNELIDIERALAIVSHTPESLSKIFDSSFPEYNCNRAIVSRAIGRPNKNSYLQPFTLAIKRCKTIIKNKGFITAEYKVANDNRNYASNSIQLLKADIRGYLLYDYLDFDIINCLPTLLLYLSKENNLNLPFLDFYVNKRKSFLEKYSTTKQKINILINSEQTKYISKKLIPLKEEIEELANKYGGLKNMIKEAYSLETKILFEIYNNVVKFEICEKDGFYLNKKTLTKYFISKNNLGYEIQDFINILNLETLKYGIKWKNKELEGLNIKVPLLEIEDENSKDYDKMKNWLDEQLFLTRAPPALWYKTIEENQSIKYKQIKQQDANMIFRPYTFFDDNNKEKCIFPAWLDDKERKTYEGIVFKPYGIKGKDTAKKGYFNTFQGFDIWNHFNNYEDFINNWKSPNEEYLKYFIEYIEHLTGNDKEKTDYLINWISLLFQRPSEKPDVYLLLKGEQGAGKDTLFIIISLLIGNIHSYDTENPSRLLGNFNADLEGKIFTAINELKSSDGYKYSSELKALITNNKTTINQKNEKTYRQDNFNHFIFLSNQEKPAHIESTDRRAFVCNTGKKLLNNREFWNKFYFFMKDKDFLLTIYKYFMSQDLKEFEPTKRPITKEMNIMKEQNIPQVYSFLKTEAEKLLNNEKSNLWIYHSKSNSYICSKKKFKHEYSSFLHLLPYFENASMEDRKKYIHFEEQGNLNRISDVGFNLKKIQKCNINTQAWIFEPKKLLDYFEKVNMFPTIEEDFLELEDEYLELLEADYDSE